MSLEWSLALTASARPRKNRTTQSWWIVCTAPLRAASIPRANQDAGDPNGSSSLCSSRLLGISHARLFFILRCNPHGHARLPSQFSCYLFSYEIPCTLAFDPTFTCCRGAREPGSAPPKSVCFRVRRKMPETNLRPTCGSQKLHDKVSQCRRHIDKRNWTSAAEEVLSVATRGARYRLFAARGLTPRMLGTGQAAALLSSSLKDVS